MLLWSTAQKLQTTILTRWGRFSNVYFLLMFGSSDVIYRQTVQCAVQCVFTTVFFFQRHRENAWSGHWNVESVWKCNYSSNHTNCRSESFLRVTKKTGKWFHPKAVSNNAVVGVNTDTKTKSRHHCSLRGKYTLKCETKVKKKKEMHIYLKWWCARQGTAWETLWCKEKTLSHAAVSESTQHVDQSLRQPVNNIFIDCC